MKTEADAEVISNLYKKTSSTKLLFEALKLISPLKVGVGRFLVFILISLVLSFLIAWSVETIQLFINAVQVLNTATIGLFGIVFMGYAFFQALINDDLLMRLLSIKKQGDDKESKLQESNEYFAKVMILDILAIFINILIIIIFSSIEKNLFFILWGNVSNNIITTLVISLYLYFSLNVVWEMKCFVFNLFQLFNAHAATKAVDILNRDKDNK